MSTGLKIGDVAKRTGVAVSAIRFYEDKGLLTSERNSGGQRIFTRADIRRVSFIIIAQKLGFSLRTIKTQLSSFPNNRTPTKADWEKLSLGFAEDIDARIEALSRLKGRLTGCIGCGCLSLKVCELYNNDDLASQNGTGPRYLLGDLPELSKNQ